MASSPSTLQRVLTKALGNLVGKCCAVYCDDVLIYSKDIKQHLKDLRAVLAKLSEAQLRLKEKKCKFCMTALEYLGVRLSGEGTRPTTTKIRQLISFHRPESYQDVKALLGVVSWLRGFIPHVATWMQPLQELANSRTPWTGTSWQPQHQRCLEVLVHLLISEPVLRTPDPRQPFAIMTDA